MVSPEASCGEGAGGVEASRLRSLRKELDSEAPDRQSRAALPAANERQEWPSAITSYFKKAATIAGRSDLRSHDLRRTGTVMAAR